MGKLKVHPLFILLCIVAIIFGYGGLFFCYISVLILHEIGHSTVARRLGYTLNNFCLLPQGALVYGFQKFRSYSDEIKIALAGPFVNVCLIIVSLAVWWLIPESYALTETWVFCNIAIALFNLLPILPLDGGRAVLALFAAKNKRKLGIVFVNVFGITISFLCLIVFIVSLFYTPNITYLTMSIFLFIGVIGSHKEHMYISVVALHENKLKNMRACRANSMVICGNKNLAEVFLCLSKNKFNILYVASEDGEVVCQLFEPEILTLLEKHSLNTKLFDCI